MQLHWWNTTSVVIVVIVVVILNGFDYEKKYLTPAQPHNVVLVVSLVIFLLIISIWSYLLLLITLYLFVFNKYSS